MTNADYWRVSGRSSKSVGAALSGERTSAFMRAAAGALAAKLPPGELRELQGEGHDINPGPTAAMVTEFFTVPTK